MLRLLGLIFIVLAVISITCARMFPKIRFLMFKDASMVWQYGIGLLLLLFGLILLYFSGAFNR